MYFAQPVGSTPNVLLCGPKFLSCTGYSEVASCTVLSLLKGHAKFMSYAGPVQMGYGPRTSSAQL